MLDVKTPGGGLPMTATRPFRAFVSYCRADRVFAASLQRRLEAYRLPRRLADRVEPLSGQVRGRIGPVFRDRADLSAAQDLSAAVQEAIAASSALVVVASPDAALSFWVMREIALFRELHPDAPVLVALARGEPAEAIPVPLLRPGTEPLAADFRPDGDGRRLAFLKIVAGLAGLPLDALVQRDAQRQVRRVMVVTLGTAVIALGMAGLLMAALEARSEAEQRRTGAEGLVRFMLTTLRGRLREIGRLETMQETNREVLRYFDDQGDPSTLSDGSIELRALTLHAIGEDQLTGGSLPKARERFEEAYGSTAAVLRRRPGDPDAIYAHAQSAYWVGRQALQRDEFREAEARWVEYLEQAQALHRVEPKSRRSLMELGYANGNLCHLKLSNRANAHSAIAYCRASIAFERAALATPRSEGDPTDAEIRLAIANRLGWLADSLNESGAYAEALASRKEEQRLVAAALAENPQDAVLRERVIAPRIGMAKIAVARGEVDAGIAQFRSSLGDLERLHASFPENQGLLLQRVRVTLLIADALLGTDRGEWAAYCDRAEALLRNNAAQGQSSEALGRLSRFLAEVRKRGKK